jgi:hypothetical protein
MSDYTLKFKKYPKYFFTIFTDDNLKKIIKRNKLYCVVDIFDGKETRWSYYSMDNLFKIETELLKNNKNIALLNLRNNDSNWISGISQEIISGNKLYYKNVSLM